MIQNHCFNTIITIRKLTNTNRNTSRMFLSVNYSEFYQKHILSVYTEEITKKKTRN